MKNKDYFLMVLTIWLVFSLILMFHQKYEIESQQFTIDSLFSSQSTVTFKLIMVHDSALPDSILLDTTKCVPKWIKLEFDGKGE